MQNQLVVWWLVRACVRACVVCWSFGLVWVGLGLYRVVLG